MTLCGLSTAVAGWLTWSTPQLGVTDTGTLPASVHRAAFDDQEASPPTRIHGPAGLDAAVVPVAARADGALDLPENLHTGGWWALGAAVGAATGTVLIAGHVDNRKDGVGPFAALYDIPVGGPITVTGADTKARTYRVTARRTYQQEHLPRDLFTRAGPHRLALITCAGPYNRAARRYERNLVLYATPTEERAPRPLRQSPHDRLGKAAPPAVRDGDGRRTRPTPTPRPCAAGPGSGGSPYCRPAWSSTARSRRDRNHCRPTRPDVAPTSWTTRCVPAGQAPSAVRVPAAAANSEKTRSEVAIARPRRA
ncbi:class F sortase [Streptomyces sp. NPDC001070]